MSGITPLRLGAKKSPPTLYLEFKQNGAVSHHKLTLTQEAVDLDSLSFIAELRRAFPQFYTVAVQDDMVLDALAVIKGTGKDVNLLSKITHTARPTPSTPPTAASQVSNKRDKAELDDELAELLAGLTTSPIDKNIISESIESYAVPTPPTTKPSVSYSTIETVASSTSRITPTGSQVTASSVRTPPKPVQKDDLAIIANIGDLQKAGPAALQAAKAKMEIVFDKHRVKPGDEDYIYDKQVEFQPTEQSDWD